MPISRSNISALIAEQYKENRPFIRVTKKGERVIVDPAATVSRIYHYFYLMINVGALCGQIAMVYAEKYVGFWLSYLCPTIMFCFAPVVLFFCKKIYVLTPPSGSIYGKAMRVWGLAMKGRWSINPVRTYVATDFFNSDRDSANNSPLASKTSETPTCGSRPNPATLLTNLLG